MKQLIFIYAFVLLVNINVPAQWYWQKPKATSNNLNALWVKDSTYFIAGDYGTIINSSDKGLTWKIDYNPTKIDPTSVIYFNFQSIYFINNNVGWAVGSKGEVIKTTDGGKTWEYVTIFPKSYVNQIFFRDNLHGYIIGANNFYTNDGGLTWYTFTAGNMINSSGSFYRYIWFVDENDGFIAAEGLILKTTDGGGSWKVVLRPSFAPRAIYFRDYNHGCLVGNSGQIYYTTNGGISWRTPLTQPPTNEDLLGVYFKNDSDGFVVGKGTYNGVIYKTTDGGANWEKLNYITANGLNAITFLDKNNGLIVGSNGTVLNTSDGGNNWQIISGRDQNSFESVTFFDDSTGWSAGSNGIMYKTTNRGYTWKTNIIDTATTVDVSDIVFINRDLGWLVSYANGLVYRTTDGGHLWERMYGLPQYLTSISFADDKTGCLTGVEGCFYRSVDGGLNWNYIDIGQNTWMNFNGVKFITQNTGFVIIADHFNNKNLIYKTKDKGNSWQSVYETSDYAITSISFKDSLHVWAFLNSNSGNKILSTTDEGSNWLSSPAPHEINGKVYFINNSTGWIAGVGSDGAGYIYKTTDGGMSWDRILGPVSSAFHDITFTKSGIGYVVGSNGAILSINTNNITAIKNLSNSSGLKSYKLFQNYPNPFNPSTKIEYSISKTSFVTLKVYDILGREVAVLVNEEKSAGSYKVEFDGGELSSGVYFYELQARGHTLVNKMILLK